jgi:hypothetical protein
MQRITASVKKLYLPTNHPSLLMSSFAGSLSGKGQRTHTVINATVSNRPFCLVLNHLITTSGQVVEEALAIHEQEHEGVQWNSDKAMFRPTTYYAINRSQRELRESLQIPKTFDPRSKDNGHGSTRNFGSMDEMNQIDPVLGEYFDHTRSRLFRNAAGVLEPFSSL